MPLANALALIGNEMTTNNAALADFDALMDASMDDIDDLPPIGVPPTGNYDLEVTASREKAASGSEYIKFSYLIKNVNEVKNPDEAAECAADQKFMEMFSPFKKDGTINEIGMGMLKERCSAFSAHFGTTKMGDTLQEIKSVAIVATLVRRADKREEGRFNFSLKDVAIV
jgi:hypothetical protein